MTRYGEEYKLNTEEMENIATYMNDEIREDLHFEMAPCEPEEFLRAYVDFNPRSREGSDFIPCCRLICRHHFNPRSREGSDVILFCRSIQVKSISIHAPARGAT